MLTAPLRRDCARLASLRRPVVASGFVLTVLLLGAGGCAASRGGAGADLTAWEAPAHSVWLDSLDISLAKQGWGQPQACRSVDGNLLALRGTQYLHGLGTHAIGRFDINLHGQAKRFDVRVGVDDETGSSGSVVFVVVADDREVSRSATLRGGQAPQSISVDLSGVKRLSLRVEDAGDGIGHDHGDWAGGLIELLPNASARPEAVVVP